jgi:hypothetical protein
MLSHLSPQLDRRRFGYCYCFLLSRRGRTRRLHNDAQRSQTNRKHRVAWIYDFSPFCKRTKLDNARRRRDSFRPRCKRLPWALSAICAIAKWAGSRPFMGQARWTTQAAFFPASDRMPSDVLPLSFLGKGCDGASAPLADQIRGRLQSFLASDAKKADVSYHLAACLWKRSSTDSKADRDIQVESLLKRALAAVDPQIMAMRISNSEFRRPLSASTLKQPKNVRGAQNNSRLCQYSLPSRASLSAVWQLCPRTRGVRQLRAAQ